MASPLGLVGRGEGMVAGAKMFCGKTSPNLLACRTLCTLCGFQYEFDDWSTRISVEINLHVSSAPEYREKWDTLTKINYYDLPKPVITDQRNWLKLQFFFDETIPVEEICRAVDQLIDQTFCMLSQYD